MVRRLCWRQRTIPSLAVNRLMVEYGYISAATAEEHKAYMFKAH